MAVIGELVQTQVGLHGEPAGGRLGRDADGAVEDTVRIDRAGADRVAVGRDAEQHDAADTRSGSLLDDGREAVERMLRHARHARDGLRRVDVLFHEHRQHELRGVQPGLGDEAPQGGAVPQAAQAPDGIRGHGVTSGDRGRESSSASRASTLWVWAVWPTVKPRRSASRVVPGPIEATRTDAASCGT